MYGQCPKISYTKVSDKMAYENSADPDQTGTESSVQMLGKNFRKTFFPRK